MNVLEPRTGRALAQRFEATLRSTCLLTLFKMRVFNAILKFSGTCGFVGGFGFVLFFCCGRLICPTGFHKLNCVISYL